MAPLCNACDAKKDELNHISFFPTDNYILGVALTNHSLWPCLLGLLRHLIATAIPFPCLVAVSECGSIQPLNTNPKPPCPNTRSGWKFLVAVLSSSKLKTIKLPDSKNSYLLEGLCGGETDGTIALDLKSPSSWLESFRVEPTYRI